MSSSTLPAQATPGPTFPIRLGEFRLVGEIGRGGSGVVYAGTWGHREIALKVLHPDIAATDKAREQFVLEAKRLLEMNHPSVVKVLAVGLLDDGRPYVAMEKLQGQSLAERLAEGPLSPDLVMRFTDQLAGAVAAMHDRGLVHRDLKPENVFLVNSRHAVLLDFGIAKDLFSSPSTTTQDGGIRGTPAYMAPERFFGQPAGVPTDIYELAVVIYAMICGDLPWSDVADPSTRLDPRPLPNGPASVDTELRLAMSTRAANRPSSAFELARKLQVAWQQAGHEPSASDTAPLRSELVSAAVAQLGIAPTVVAPVTPNQPWFNRQSTGGKREAALSNETLPARPERVASSSDAAVRFAAAGSPSEGFAGADIAQSQVPRPAPNRRTTRNRVVMAGVAVGVVSGAGGFVWWKKNKDAIVATVAEAPKVPLLPAEKDPWGSVGVSGSSPRAESPSEASPTKETVGPSKALVKAIGDAPQKRELHKQIEAAILSIPERSSVVVALATAEVREVAEAVDLVGAVARSKPVAPALAVMPECGRRLFAQSDWIVLSARNRDLDAEKTFQIRGRWDSKAVVDCLTGGDEQKLDGKTEGTFLGVFSGTLLWQDSVITFSSYSDLSASKVAALRSGPGERVHQLLDGNGKEQTLSVAIEVGDNAPMEALPTATSMRLALQLANGRMIVNASADCKTAVHAAALEKMARDSFGSAFGSTSEFLNVQVERKNSSVHLSAKLPSIVLASLAKSWQDKNN